MRSGERGLAAPAIYAFDLDQGFLLIEDLGDRVFGAEIAHGTKLAELCAPAVDVLLAMASEPTPPLLPIEGHAPYRLPPYDAEALLTEALLLIDWFWPALHGRPTPEEVREAYVGLWRPLLEQAAAADNTLILRDYHSPNLMWLPERAGLQQVGILDFQDALQGPAAYDLVSLCRTPASTCPKRLKPKLLARYCAARSAQRSAIFERSVRRALRNARRPTQLEDPRHLCAVGET